MPGDPEVSKLDEIAEKAAEKLLELEDIATNEEGGCVHSGEDSDATCSRCSERRYQIVIGAALAEAVAEERKALREAVSPYQDDVAAWVLMWLDERKRLDSRDKERP